MEFGIGVLIMLLLFFTDERLLKQKEFTFKVKLIKRIPVYGRFN